MDPYRVLGVKRSATKAEIRRAYHKLAKQYHPDLNKDDKVSGKKFREIAIAYDVLSDDDKRNRFDKGEWPNENIGTASRAEPNCAYKNHFGKGRSADDNLHGNFNFNTGAYSSFSTYAVDDFLASMLGRGTTGRVRSVRGSDRSLGLTINFIEATTGAMKTIRLPDGRHLEVVVPPGIENGSVLRLRGQGELGLGKGEPGDLLVSVSVKEHPILRRSNTDILIDLPVELLTAIEGGKVPVPTIDGTVMLNIPAHSNTGHVLRLRGKGITCQGKEPGDQLVTLKVMLPEPMPPELERAILITARSTTGKAA